MRASNWLGEITAGILLLLLCIVAFAVFPGLPQQIPTRFDLWANVLGKGDKGWIFLFPALAAAGYALLTLLAWRGYRRNQGEEKDSQRKRAFWSWVSHCKLYLMMLLAVFGLLLIGAAIRPQGIAGGTLFILVVLAMAAFNLGMRWKIYRSTFS